MASAYAGQVVRTRGVVTARKFNGLYLQSEPGTEDGNPATSDGIFIFNRGNQNLVEIGDRAEHRVGGHVPHVELHEHGAGRVAPLPPRAVAPDVGPRT